MKEEIGTGLVVSITVSYWVIGIMLLQSLLPLYHQTERATVIWQTRYVLILVIPLCASFAGIAGVISGGVIARLSHFRKKTDFFVIGIGGLLAFAYSMLVAYTVVTIVL
jgi:hypothetical protein